MIEAEAYVVTYVVNQTTGVGRCWAWKFETEEELDWYLDIRSESPSESYRVIYC
jgi:hypothetical protein